MALKWCNFFSLSAGEPNNKGGQEFCVEISAEIMSARWNDIECNRNFGYICKKPATTATVHPSAEPTKPPGHHTITHYNLKIINVVRYTKISSKTRLPI